jgi:RNA polymerase sigma-70 factor (ECF subfamily)
MEKLCRAYWPPIFAHLRFKGYPLHQAQDLAQEFFSRLLQNNTFATVSPDKGRFRTFMLAALKHFLINEWKRERTLKRGGGVMIVDLDALDPAVRDACEPRSEDDPAVAYDRQWALTVIAKVRSRLRMEYEAAGQLDRHDALKFHLMDSSDPVSCAETAELLGVSESAAKSAIHRIRQRFGHLLRAEITRTVTDEGDVEDEIRHLLSALRS